MSAREDGIFDVGSGAATAAHDQTAAEALDAIRNSDQFVCATMSKDGEFGLMVSGGFQFVAYTERVLGQHAFRILVAEINEIGTDVWRDIAGEDE